MTTIDQVWEQTREGDPLGFTSWVRACEPALRRSLRGFARAVDVESVLQEGLLRMWRLAPTLELEGESASLRYAHTLVRNLALSEARRHARVSPVDIAELEGLPGTEVEPVPPPDAGLREAILICIGKLPPRPKAALKARLAGDPDRELARRCGMQLNTFLQNIVRARALLKTCLRRRGVRLEEYLA